MIKTKRVLSLLFALAMLVSVLGSGALAANYEPVSIAEGEPVNPYTYNTTGGNAYDISWAVNDNGEPVRLNGISKIRVYTSAALKVSGTGDLSEPDAPLFTTPAIFGETSAEVCGIYAVNPGASEVGVTAEPTIRINGTAVTATSVSDNTAVYDSGGLLEEDVISVTAASGANLWINNANSSSYTVTADDQMVRVIVQSGEKEPYIVVIK